MVGLLHRAWRGLPAGPRRRALAAATELLAPRPDPAPGLADGVAVAGELGRASGLGEGARLMLAGLRALGVPCWEVGPGRALPPEGVPLVLHLNAAALPGGMLRLGRRLLRGRRLVGVWPWELPVVPASWHAGFRYVHEVWAPSRFSAAAIERAMPPGFGTGFGTGFGVGKVRVVPYPVACQAIGPGLADLSALGVPVDAVVTLVVFSLASSFVRKNPLAAVAAHRAAFGARRDRVLLLRVGEAGSFPADLAVLRAAAADLPNVVIDTRALDRAGAHAMLAASDIVLSLHRSEGFGLVPAEALLAGRAVVATGWSGTEDFLDDAWAMRVPYRLVPAVDPRGVFEAAGAEWAEPDVAAATLALRRLADDAGLRARLGAAGQAAARRLLGPAALGDAVRAMRAAA